MSLCSYIHLTGLQMTVCLSSTSLFITISALWDSLRVEKKQPMFKVMLLILLLSQGINSWPLGNVVGIWFMARLRALLQKLEY